MKLMLGSLTRSKQDDPLKGLRPFYRLFFEPFTTDLLLMYFDRFDIVEAYHLWFSDYYSGFDSNYCRRCRIETNLKFSPSPFHSYEHLSENGKMIYDNLEEKKFVSRDY